MSKQMIQEWKRSSDKRKSELLEILPALKKKDKRAFSSKADKTHERVFRKIDCLDCANCCTSIPPIVTKADTRRLANHLNLTESDFYDAYLLRDEDGDTVINSSPCPFLESDNKCKVYDVRPKACRAYPHTGDSEFLDHIHLHKLNIHYCPAVFHILERLSHYK